MGSQQLPKVDITCGMNKTLLPDPAVLKLESMVPSDDAITFHVKTTQPEACCPICQHPSGKVHSRYNRSIADLPWQGVAIGLILTARRFFCPNDLCHRRIFTEPLPSAVKRYARKTVRLNEALTLIGFALGGEAGARVAAGLAMHTSPDTLLRRIRQSVLVEHETPRVLGVDDWSFRRGHHYGTILIDLEKRCPIELLPDREAETLRAWLQSHPGIEIISRDRATAYAEAARTGAPDAIQVADRFHLLKNLVDAVTLFLKRQHRPLHQTAEQMIPNPSDSQPIPQPPETKPKRVSLAELNRERKKARYTEVRQMHQQGGTIKGIARHFRMNRRLVRQYIRSEEFPERAKPPKRQCHMDRFREYLKKRWDEGCHNSTQLWKEIRAQGYRGGQSSLRHHLTQWREQLPPQMRDDYRHQAGTSSKPFPVPSIRRLTWAILNKLKGGHEPEREFITKLEERCPQVTAVKQLGQDFFSLVNERRTGALQAWLDGASQSGIAELKSFAKGLMLDKAAVTAALSSDWSNGPVEGQVNRLKNLKRQMYGRAKFDLLRARVLHSG
jgi:transposase